MSQSPFITECSSVFLLFLALLNKTYLWCYILFFIFMWLDFYHNLNWLAALDTFSVPCACSQRLRAAEPGPAAHSPALQQALLFTLLVCCLQSSRCLQSGTDKLTVILFVFSKSWILRRRGKRCFLDFYTQENYKKFEIPICTLFLAYITRKSSKWL